VLLVPVTSPTPTTPTVVTTIAAATHKPMISAVRRRLGGGTGPYPGGKALPIGG